MGARLEGRLARFETVDGNVHRYEVAYPTLFGLIRARPFAGEAGVERGFELRGFFSHAVALSSRNTLTDEPVETRFWRLSMDVSMMFEADPAVELGMAFGFGYDAYTFGEQSLVIVPTAEYLHLRPSLRTRFQLVGEVAVLELEAGFRGVLSRGALSDHFGEGGDTVGFDAVARLGGSADVGISWGLEAGMLGYVHFFDGDAATAAGSSGSDYALWLGAQVGYAFR